MYEAIAGKINKNATEYIYDKLGRVIQKNIPFDNKTGEMSVVKYEYDKNGNIIKEMVKSKTSDGRESQRVTKKEYDSRNRVTKVTALDKNGKELYTEYGYDNVGNQILVKTGNGTRDMKYEYDALNRLTKIIYPTGKEEKYGYDLEGNLSYKVDRNGIKTEYSYNALKQLMEEKPLKTEKLT